VIVSNHRSRAFQDAAVTAGAAAYVLKDEILDKLLPALALVLEQ
jgi:DNA-binding NarL/FixJ family response regulator